MKNSSILVGLTFSLCISIDVFAQEKGESSYAPAIRQMRAEEDYSFLNDNDSTKLLLESLKWIQISPKNDIYLTFGGQYRPRVEYFNNVNYSTKDQFYYSQRLALNADLKLGKYLRVFGELYHGSTTDGNIFLQSDALAWHQGFLEVSLPLKENNRLSFRVGRQEMDLGGSRFIGLREGPNIRQSFDLVKVNAEFGNIKLLAFYGSYVNPEFEVFDNSFDLFSPGRADPIVWSAGGRVALSKIANHNLDFYYVGFHSDQVKLNDVIGEEYRQSLGIRSFGSAGNRWTYNTEIIYQFGDLAGNSISAFNIETDWKYDLKTKIRTLLGLKLEVSSGDRKQGDGKLQTFNPLFVNPAIYSLAGLNTPANMTSLHPNVTFIFEQMTIYIDYATFYRTSLNDGLYTPPRFLIRESNDIKDRKIGDTFGLSLSYRANRNASFDLRTTYFIAGDFIEASGSSENIFYIAPTVNFRF